MAMIISVDVFEAMERLSDMQLNIREFGHDDIHDELLDWQTEDMHRKYPNIDSDQEYVSWFTQIWPRSRTYDQTHRTHGQTARRRSRMSGRSSTPRLATVPRLVGGAAKRPILREALFNRLVQRMGDLLGERLAWRRTGGGFTGSRAVTGGAAAATAKRMSMLGPANLSID